jgi:SAM-dependent methyltransferase
VSASGHQHFKDHFSLHSAEYATYRPLYPPALADFLAEISAHRELAWEAGCGNGQLSTLLADRFATVIATDASASQVKNAKLHPHVEYKVCPAEASGLADSSGDLAVAAQAAHWFDLDAYYAEVRRVVRPGGAVALITYNLFTIEPKIDEIIVRFYNDVTFPYWPPERRLVESAYSSMAFPFERIPTPQLEMTLTWTLPQVIGYVTTWSAFAPLIKARGRAEFDDFCGELAEVWGAATLSRPIHWPLTVLAGHV